MIAVVGNDCRDDVACLRTSGFTPLYRGTEQAPAGMTWFRDRVR